MKPTLNCRCLLAPVSGVQRFTLDLSKSLGLRVARYAPRKRMSGIFNHIWEQLILPAKVKGPLINPANSAPVNKKNQIVCVHDAVVFDHPNGINLNLLLHIDQS